MGNNGMMVIDNHELLGEKNCELLSSISATPFAFGGLASLRDIIDGCRVDVEARKGVDNCPIPKELLDLKNYWKEKLDEINRITSNNEHKVIPRPKGKRKN